MSESMFEKAGRLKLRFDTPAGMCSVEDLWDLPLTASRNSRANLDDIAKGLSKEVKNSEEESFVSRKTTANEVSSLKFELVKHIISIRLAENEAKANAVAEREKKSRIRELIAKKKDAALESMDIAELEKLVAD